MSKCPNVQMSKCPNVHIFKCPNVSSLFTNHEQLHSSPDDKVLAFSKWFFLTIVQVDHCYWNRKLDFSCGMRLPILWLCHRYEIFCIEKALHHKFIKIQFTNYFLKKISFALDKLRLRQKTNFGFKTLKTVKLCDGVDQKKKNFPSNSFALFFFCCLCQCDEIILALSHYAMYIFCLIM